MFEKLIYDICDGDYVKWFSNRFQTFQLEPAEKEQIGQRSLGANLDIRLTRNNN
jgi:hypothetical protein